MTQKPTDPDDGTPLDAGPISYFPTCEPIPSIVETLPPPAPVASLEGKRIRHQTIFTGEDAPEPPADEAAERARLEQAKTVAVSSASDPPRPRMVTQDYVAPERRIPSVHPTQRFFLDGRVKSDTDPAIVTGHRRGRYVMKTFLGLGESVPRSSIVSTGSSDEASSRTSGALAASDQLKEDSYAMIHGRRAMMRTLNFLDFMISQSPRHLRASLEMRRNILSIPRHLPDDDVIYRFEYFARSIGYTGPVLWFIPPELSFDDLAAADLLSKEFWKTEPNFPEGFKTLSPFDPPLDMREYREPGYWVLALPGLMPGTTAMTYKQQSDQLLQTARMVGFHVENGSIKNRHRISMFVRGIADVLVFFAIAQHAKELLTDIPIISRTATVIKAYTNPFVSKQPQINLPIHGMHERYRACVEVRPHQILRITEWIDGSPSQGVGLTPFFVPHIYD